MLTILLVEDNSADAELVKDALAKASQPGFNVVCVARLSQAVRQLSEGGIDAVLLDLELPDSCGIDTFVEISRAAPETSIIVLIPSDDSSLVADLLNLDMQNYLVKTEIRPSALAGMLVCSIEHKRALIGLQAKYDDLHKCFSAIREGKVDAIIGSDPESTVFHLEDLTLYEENKRLAKELTRSNVELKKLDEAKSEFLSTASHELRTPLTIIKEYVGLLHDGIVGPITSDQKECLELTLRNCNRLANLINDVLDLQCIDSGRLRIRRKKTDVTALLENCHRDFLPQCQMKNQRLELQVSESLPPVLCDPDKLTQVLVNLIGNAQKFTPNGGTITVRADIQNADDKQATISVEDTGPGISAEDQTHVFDKFTQLNRQHGAGSKGTGLGLAIAQNIIDLHGGKISVDSFPDKGSTFSFTLPLYSEFYELSAFVSDHLSVRRADDSSSLIIFIKTDDKASNESPNACIAKKGILERINKCVCNTLRRKNDETIVLQGMKLLAIAAETVNSGAESLRRRIEQSLVTDLVDGDSLLIAGGVAPATDSVSNWIAKALNQFVPVRPMNQLKRVLIIDDEETMLSLISEILESSSLNLQIITSDNGYKGCLHFGEFKPHLVILDISMPGFDGTEVLIRIKESPHWEKTKVMVVSGHSGQFQEFERLGADDFLAKPFRPNALVEKVTSLLKDGVYQTPIEPFETVSS